MHLYIDVLPEVLSRKFWVFMVETEKKKFEIFSDIPNFVGMNTDFGDYFAKVLYNLHSSEG
jgi:predicted nucleic acid-binding OB-fold protein